MRKFLLMLIAGMLVLPFSVQAQNKYIGVKMCKMCHQTEKQGKQFDVWQKSKHAGAFKTLTTAKANEVAKAKGLSKPAAESPECLECNVSNFNMDAKIVEKSFDFKDGVQCETCHGAGSKYKDLATMKSREKSVAAGMREFKDNAATEAHCKTCHNEKSPSYKEFKFDEMWAKIKHSVPKAG
ncbi:MAG: cytochrome c554 [Bacteroidetes bacterium]|nr:cytochrome c554 [Bacteroidota bacterium]